MIRCDNCRHKSVTAGALPCRVCEGYSLWEKPVPTWANRFRSIIATHQIESWTQIYRQQRALAPILTHAEAHDYAPPLKFSVAACREIKEKVNG